MSEARKAQVLVVSGFLGSGKTTLVRSLLEQGQRDGIRTAVVSNEFGELGIDEALLASEQGDFVELAGGCVCCRLSDDLLRTLQQLWERAHPERIVVETSGVALPYDTLINFWRDPVRQWAIDEASVVVVSAEQVAAGRDLEGLFEDQVLSADFVLLSKADLVTAAEADRAAAHLEAMQPGTPLLRAVRGDVDARVFFPPSPGSRAARREAALPEPAPHAHDHDRFVSRELVFRDGLPAADVEAAVAAQAALRAKGFVRCAEGLRVVQGVAGRVELTTAGTDPPAAMIGRVVLIEHRKPPIGGHA